MKTILKYRSYHYDSEYNYYLGRVIGDAISLIKGIGSILLGLKTIISTILGGSAITVGSGGTLAIGGFIVVQGVIAGTVEVAYGGTVVVAASSNFNKDYSRFKEASKSKGTGDVQQLKKLKNNSDANKIAEEYGYRKAEDFKEYFVGKANVSKYNIKYNPKTGEIVLEAIQGGKQVPTGLQMPEGLW